MLKNQVKEAPLFEAIPNLSLLKQMSSEIVDAVIDIKKFHYLQCVWVKLSVRGTFPNEIIFDVTIFDKETNTTVTFYSALKSEELKKKFKKLMKLLCDPNSTLKDFSKL
jgi:hypothetical protein